MAKNTPATVPTYSIRGAARFLQDNGVDVGEMRMRALLRQHAIFTSDPATQKVKQGDSELELWSVSETALRNYIQAVKTGTVRTSSGSKVYRITLSAEQLAELRTWAAERGIAEPVRANKAYTKKAAANGAEAEREADLAAMAEGEDGEEDLFGEQESVEAPAE